MLVIVAAILMFPSEWLQSEIFVEVTLEIAKPVLFFMSIKPVSTSHNPLLYLTSALYLPSLNGWNWLELWYKILTKGKLEE